MTALFSSGVYASLGFITRMKSAFFRFANAFVAARLRHVRCEFAKSTAAEAPLVIGYIVALMLFAFGWSNFGPL